jgi:hypothetical protein
LAPDIGVFSVHPWVNGYNLGMPVTRRQLEVDALEALIDAMTQAGLPVTPNQTDGPGATADLVLDGPSGPIPIEIKAASAPVPSRIAAMIREDDAQGRHPGQPSLTVLVADEIPESSRQLLREHGWGYLDRRGRLWLRTADVLVNDTDIDPLPRISVDGPNADPLGGRASQGVALAMLMHPEAEWSVRGLARSAACSVSMAHKVLKQLQGAALVQPDNRPLTPELFWALADVWRPQRHYVSNLPTPGKFQQLPGKADELEKWVISNDVAAASWGAPVVVRSAQLVDFYLPGVDVSRAVRLLGAAEPELAAASVAVAPSPTVLAESFDPASGTTPWRHWRVAHPIVVALDLAQDRSRGREILEEWVPPAEFVRVW